MTPATTQTTAVAPAGGKGNLTSLQRLLETYKAQIAVALPKHMTPERMIRVALSAVSGNELLMKCDPLSVCASIVQASILGLEPNSLLGEAYLIPFWNSKLSVPGTNKKGGYSCQLMPGYLGLVKLARNSGQVSVIDAQPVHENDDFDFEKGSDTWWRHKWAKTGDRGRIIGYWAGYVLKDGAKNFEYMTVEAIEEHRDKYSQGAYKTHWNEEKKRKDFDLDASGNKILQGPWADSGWMYRKTPLKQVIKLMPKSIEVQAALAIDERVSAGLAPQFTVEMPLELMPPSFNEPDDDGKEPITIQQPQRKSEKKDPPSTTETEPADVWPEVLKAWGGDEEEALKALNSSGYPVWSEVPKSIQAKLAMELILEAKR